MICSIEDRIKEAQEGATKVFLKNATSFSQIGNTITREADKKFPLDRLKAIFSKKLKDVEDWAALEYGEKFKFGWGNITSTDNNTLSITLNPPQNLVDAYRVKFKELTLEQINNSIKEEPTQQVEIETPLSEAYNEISSVPGLKQEPALKMFKSLFTPSFKEKFGDWEVENTINKVLLNKDGEPKLFFKTKNNQVFNNYADALRNADSGVIEAGYISTDDILETTSQDMFDLSLSDFTKFGDNYKLLNDNSFIKTLNIPLTASDKTIQGFINRAILEGYLKDAKTIAGETIEQKMVNKHFLKNLNTKYIKVRVNNDFSFEIVRVGDYITLQGKEYKKSDLVERYLRGENVQNILGITDINLLLVDYVKAQKTEANQEVSLRPTQEEEDSLMANLMSFLKQLGFSVTTITDYAQNYKIRNGVDLSVEAITDVANNVVAFAEGKLNLENLAEETAHIIVEAHKNKDEINNILSEVVGTQEYNEYNEIYREKYSELYEAEELENAVRKEILGKILAKSIIEQYSQTKTQIPQTILDTLRNVFQNFINNLRQYYVPSQRVQLKQYIRQATDIARRKNDLDINGMGQNTILYSVGTKTKEERDLESKDRKQKVLLTKLSRTLETRLSTKKSLKDPEVSKIQTSIKELQDAIDDNNLKLGATIAIRTHANQVNALERRLKDYEKQKGSGKVLFSQEDYSAYNYLNVQAKNVLSEFSALMKKEDIVLAKKLDSLIQQISLLQGSVLAQQSNDPMNIVQSVIDLKGEENISEKERQELVKLVENAQTDINGWTGLFSGLQHAGNIFNNWLSKVISDNKVRASIKTNEDIYDMISKAKKGGWNMQKFKQIIKYIDGENSGYMLSKVKYEEFYKAKKDYYRKIYVDILGEDVVKDYENKKKALTPSLITSDRFPEYAERVLQWKLENEELPFKDSYYSDRNEQYNTAGLSTETRLFLEEISRRRAIILGKYRVNGKVDYSKMTEVERDDLALIRQEVKERKSLFDSETGKRKEGLELQYAEELIRLDELRREKAEGRSKDISKDFISEISKIENTQGRQAAVNFLMANGGIALSEEYWSGVTKSDTKNRLLQIASTIENEAERNRVSGIIEHYAELLELRKAILKQHTSDLNPSEIDATTINSLAKETFLENEEEIERTLKSINTIFSEYRKTLEPTTSLEVTTNESYDRLLADSGMTELEFIKNNTNDSSREKIKRFENGLKGFGLTNLYLEKFIVKYMVNKYALGVYNNNGKLNEIATLKNIEAYLRKNGKDGVTKEYAKTKVAGYFKRFAPEGYSDLLNQIKNGTESVAVLANQINNKKIPNIRINVRYEWLEVKEEETMVNPNYVSDTESGFSKPKLERWRDEEYINFFGMDKEYNPTKNKDLYEMIQVFKEINRKSLKSYNEEGLNINKLPQISKSNTERVLGSTFSSATTNLKEWFNDNIKNRVDDLAYGERIDGEDLDESERIIPKYYLRDLETKGDVSEDLINSFTSLMYAANNYNERISTLNEVLSVEQMILQQPFENGKAPEKSNVYKQFKNFKDGYFYGVKQTKKISSTILGKEVDFSKTITWLDRLKRRTNNAFSLPIAATSAVLSNINLNIEGRVGEYMPTSSVRKGYELFTKGMKEYASNYGNIDRQDDMYMKAEFFGLHETGNRTQDRSFGLFWKSLTDLPFSFMTILSSPHALTTMYGVLDDYRLVDGEYFINFKTFKQRYMKEGKLDKQMAEIEWKKYESRSANNLLEKKPGSIGLKFKDDVISSIGKERADKTIETLRNRIESINNNIDGVISETDRSAATRHWLLNLLTSHKGWLTLAIDRRFKRNHFNFRTQQFEEGHYRSFLKILKDSQPKGFSSENFSKSFKTMQENWNNLSDLEKQNMVRVINELAVFAILSLLSILVAGAADDDDNKDNNTIQYLSYLYFKTTAEMGNTQLPMGAIEFVDVVKEPFMIFSSISDLKKDMFNFDKVERGTYEGYPKAVRALIKQTSIKQYFQGRDIKPVSDMYRDLNSAVLMFAKRKKKDDIEQQQAPEDLIDLNRD